MPNHIGNQKKNDDTNDLNLIDNAFIRELEATRFLGIGNPSESGCHLLYFFRQENLLDKKYFASESEIIKYSRTLFGRLVPKLRDRNIKRYVFIDDFCGSGQQVTEYLFERTKLIKKLKSDIELCYYVLFGTSEILRTIRETQNFDKVEALCELDDSYKCFQGGRYFEEHKDVLDKAFAEDMCRTYGNKLLPGHPLGYKNYEYLIGFYHNVPDNTLPIIWSEGYGDTRWFPAFKRYPKLNFE